MHPQNDTLHYAVKANDYAKKQTFGLVLNQILDILIRRKIDFLSSRDRLSRFLMKWALEDPSYSSQYCVNDLEFLCIALYRLNKIQYENDLR